jgi:hypothetical protein
MYPAAVGQFGTVVGRSAWEGFDWLVDLPRFPGADAGSPWYAGDDQLRPIRDQDGQDETLTWKSLPSPIEIIKESAHESEAVIEHPAERFAREVRASIVLPTNPPRHERNAYDKPDVRKIWALYGPEKVF